MSCPQSALLTDLYQLTMAHAYFELGMHETAVFELFVRRMPRGDRLSRLFARAWLHPHRQRRRRSRGHALP